jgi:four helix bundle protein
MKTRSGSIGSYRNLVVWQRAMELVVECYTLGRRLPADERYGLRSQLCRAVVSIAANIAEGFTRRHQREQRQFIAIAHASLCETETHLQISYRVGYLAEADVAEALRLCIEVGRMLTGVRKALNAAPKSIG